MSKLLRTVTSLTVAALAGLAPVAAFAETLTPIGVYQTTDRKMDFALATCGSDGKQLCVTLAAARDTIRILSWLKSNAPQTQVIVLANKVHPQAMLEISRKDFEASIERKVDLVIPAEPKVATQAAKLGQPFAKAATTAKLSQPFTQLVQLVTATVEQAEGAGDGASDASAASLLRKLNIKNFLTKAPAKA